MSQNDENNQKSPEKKDQAEKALSKLEAVRAAKFLDNPDSQWTLLQEILQEIMATHNVANPGVRVSAQQLLEELTREVSSRYEHEEANKQLLLNAIPSVQSIRAWIKKDGWNDAVWAKIRKEGLFTTAKRSEMIEAIRQRGLNRSDNAAKLWLTMSGDYSEKVEVDNSTVETFKEINSVLFRKDKDK